MLPALSIGAAIFVLTLVPLRTTAPVDRDIAGRWTFELRMWSVFAIVCALVSWRVESPTYSLSWARHDIAPGKASALTMTQVWGPYLTGTLVVIGCYVASALLPHIRTPCSFDRVAVRGSGGGSANGDQGGDRRGGPPDDEGGRPDTRGRREFGRIALELVERAERAAASTAPDSSASPDGGGLNGSTERLPPTYETAALDRLVDVLEQGRLIAAPPEDFGWAKA